MPVGDVTSTEKGTGTRYNDGKPRCELLDLHTVANSYLDPKVRNEPELAILHTLGNFTLTRYANGTLSKDEGHIENAIVDLRPYVSWFEVAGVLEHATRTKYGTGNWHKGMKWSVPLGCAVRHILRQLDETLAGEVKKDPESGLSHRAHLMCNLMFLNTYRAIYPEGCDFDVLHGESLQEISSF